MARSTFYYNISAANKKSDPYIKEKERINRIYAYHKGRYGYRRITAQLHNEGFRINHKTVLKLMQQMQLKAATRRKRYKSYKGEVGKKAPNILCRDFHCDMPNQKWATDITEIRINGIRTYLSPILDMYNGEIVSYTVSDRPDMNMIVSMLNKAVERTKSPVGVILHSDQGWHYQNPRYQMLLKKHGITQSMSRKGNCLDNAVMENFFGIMKSELLYLHEFCDIRHFKSELKEYIEYYNNERIKLKLNGKSPVQYRTLDKFNNF